MRRLAFPLLLFVLIALAHGQQATPTEPNTRVLPAFEVATIKPCPPGGQSHVGFRSFPGGRVDIRGVSIKWLIDFAFDVQFSQISGGPDWIGTDCYNVEAVPPDSPGTSGAQQTPESWTPTRKQRQMLQSLLADRFGLHCHRETQRGPLYILSRGDRPLQLKDPEDKNREPIFAVFVRGETADGEVRGANVSMEQVARELGMHLNATVLDQTGLQGSYDLHSLPFDAENRDVETAITGAMDRLGLRLKRSTGPIEAVVVDSITRPTPN